MPSRTPPPPPASPRHASSRRAAGCGNEPSRAHTYALIFAGQERRIRNGQGNDPRRRIVIVTDSDVGLAHVSPPSRLYKHAIAYPSRHENQITSASRVRSLNCCCRRRLRPVYRVHGRRESRPPKPRLSGSCTGEGRLGFWGAITRLLASVRLLRLRPRRPRHRHVFTKRS